MKLGLYTHLFWYVLDLDTYLYVIIVTCIKLHSIYRPMIMWYKFLLIFLTILMLVSDCIISLNTLIQKKMDYIGRGDQPIPMKMIIFGSINGPRAEFELNNISKALFCLSSSVEHELWSFFYWLVSKWKSARYMSCLLNTNK